MKQSVRSIRNFQATIFRYEKPNPSDSYLKFSVRSRGPEVLSMDRNGIDLLYPWRRMGAGVDKKMRTDL